MKRFFGFYKNRYQISTKNGKVFGPPSQRKQGPEKKKNAKNDQF